MNLNPFSWPFRRQYLFGVICVFGLLGYAYFAQFQLGKDPCPLCILQRIAFLVMGVFFLLGAIHAPRGSGRKIYALLISLAGLLGGAIAGRHIWLIHLPKDQVPDCGPGLGYMLETFPLSDTLKKVLTGSGECAEVNWSFLGLSMPSWCLLWFVGLSLFALIVAWKKTRSYAAIR